MEKLTLFTLVFLAGGLGTLARYGVACVVKACVDDGSPRPFPYPTIVVNAVGCLLIGAAIGWAEQGLLPRRYVPVVLVGFLGAFTTFSTFAAEAQHMWREDRWTSLLLYLAAQNLLGILFVGCGLRLVR